MSGNKNLVVEGTVDGVRVHKIVLRRARRKQKAHTRQTAKETKTNKVGTDDT